MAGAQPKAPQRPRARTGPPSTPTPTPTEVPVADQPDDPLGVDELVVARARWDKVIADHHRRWDAVAEEMRRKFTDLAAVVPAPEPPTTQPAGENDDLVERTDNGLRPDDQALWQPPQDPAWTP